MNISDANVSVLKGVGTKMQKELENLGILTVRDLLEYFPRKYIDFSQISKIAELEPDVSVVVEATVVKKMRPFTAKGITFSKIDVSDCTGEARLTFYNQPYVMGSVEVGKKYLFYGKVEKLGKFVDINAPVIEKPENKYIHPVYSHPKGISSNRIAALVKTALTAVGSNLSETLNREIIEKYSLCPLSEAYRQIHFPTSFEAREKAMRRFAFEELLLFSLGIMTLRSANRKLVGNPVEGDCDVSDFLKTLPYTLTNAQKSALDDCLSDLKKKTPMSRIVQGDVGSGKTVVAAAVMYYVSKCGRQSCLMAPTEILAVQHFASFTKLFDGLGVRCALLTGSTSAAERKKLLDRLKNGEIDVLIGTHAVFQKGVDFFDLALAVTDEQHRFGISQRSKLSEKGNGTHILVMSATPIPRTLAMILYGDMDISVIDELPPGRQKISTHLVDGSYHDRMYSYLREECLKGAQAYVVCPLVEEGDNDELRSAVEYADRLCREHLNGISVRYLHGKMKAKEKEEILRDFADGKTQVLVSTTVVEVGVDVPNATIMIIENADRFGLSQLHQLRGRVGRGTKKSYCFVSSDTKNEKTLERLKAFCSTTDGFEISRKDLEIRGPGDFFGQRQSGLPIFRHADLLTDMQTLEQAKETADNILNDPLWFTDESLVGLKNSVIELFDRVDFNIFS